jgi:hypothetical protein
LAANGSRSRDTWTKLKEAAQKSFLKSFGIGVTLSGSPSITEVRVPGWKLSPINIQPGIFYLSGPAGLFPGPDARRCC